MQSFYTGRSQERKKIYNLTVIFRHLESERLKALRQNVGEIYPRCRREPALRQYFFQTSLSIFLWKKVKPIQADRVMKPQFAETMKK